MADLHARLEGHGPSEDQMNNDTSAAEAALRAKLNRKRTKTGCLTCRKRRIKCGEERPVCKNCVKSKRHCDGYVQRVVFKPPAFDFRPVAHGGAHITFQSGPIHAVPPSSNWIHTAAHSAFSQSVPRATNHQQPSIKGYSLDSIPQQWLDTSAHHRSESLPSYFDSPMAAYHQQPFQFVSEDHRPFSHQIPSTPGSGPPVTTYEPNPSITGEAQPIHDFGCPPLGTNITAPWSSSEDDDPSARLTLYTTESPLDYRHEQSRNDSATAGINLTDFNHSSIDSGSHLLNFCDTSLAGPVPNLTSPSEFLAQAAVETRDDDYFDVHSEEDLSTVMQLQATEDEVQRYALSRILKLNSITVHELQRRRYDTFLHNGMLDTYRVEFVANPLNNPATARVFAHFISATAPSLSIFERHPRNQSVLYTEGNLPFSEQGLWTYAMPKAALKNQGLLHAILALGSLHIARLTGAARTPSVQHYAWALKRVHHYVGHPRKRLEVTTIAASMLLGYYEIVAADHLKWNLHLAGSKQLYLETDFEGMAHQFATLKRERAIELQFMDKISGHNEPIDQIPDIDERIVSRFVGKSVRYAERGKIAGSPQTLPHSLDLSNFEMLKDLFWWYCKQDAYQSITGGIPLLMDYNRWSECPPRAPLGKIDAVYGSFDHLVLLLGRVADFAARDRSRKLRQVEANGGFWKPHEDLNLGSPGPGKSFGSSTCQPAFFGMAPTPHRPGQMPSSYISGHSQTSHESKINFGVDEEMGLSKSTEAALEEYARIRTALHEFSTSLGDAFEALAPEYQAPMHTPFGPALFYRNYDIGCLWAIYNMTVIIAIRSHPHMPPAAHMAAAVAAKETAHYANEIGRIAAGIVPDSPDRPLSPALGAALCESCMPSFFAAIQYQDHAQREHTVRRILSISQRTGWGSAELIANGCETAWVKAAASGRGAPWTRLGRQEMSDDPRLSGSWERLGPNVPMDGKDDSDRRMVHSSPNARVNWAIGIMGTEYDE